MDDALLLLGVDTCGPAGSVALASLAGDDLKLLEETELAGRTYSTTLIEAVGALLAHADLRLAQVNAIVVVNGPGSFTGVRVGLSAVKGLAEPGQIPVVALSRLEVLAASAGVDSAALDAHRHEVFLRQTTEVAPRELLASRADLEGMRVRPGRIAVCDAAAAELLHAAWPETEQLRVSPPAAMDAIRLAAPRIRAGDFEDLVLLDAHYLRRSDAELFGEPDKAAAKAR